MEGKPNILMSLLVWSAVMAILTGFFMPWVSVHTRTGLIESVGVSRMARAVAGKIGAPNISAHTQVAGYQIPFVAHEDQAKLAFTVMELFIGTQDVQKRSYLVYLIPLLALWCGFLYGPKKFGNFLLVMIAGGLSVGGLYKIFVTPMDNLLVSVDIGLGLWMTLYAFLFLALAGLHGLGRG